MLTVKTQSELLALFKAVGINPIITKTGCPKWVRIIVEFDGVRYGRASINCGQFYSMKWYDQGYGEELRATDKLKAAIKVMEYHKILMTDQMWDIIVKRAKYRQEAKYQSKLDARKQLEREDLASSRKAIKKRKRIEKPGIRQFVTIEDIL